jgi:hypothetical protein
VRACCRGKSDRGLGIKAKPFPVEDDLNEMISLTVEHFMAGAQTVIPRLIEAAQSKKT